MAVEQAHNRTRKEDSRLPARLLWWGVLLLLLAICLALLVLAALPHARLQPVFNLLAADGSLEAFSPALHASLRPWAAAGSLLAAGLAFAWVFKATASQSLTQRSLRSLNAYSPTQEIRELARDLLGLETKPLALIGLGVLFIGGLLLRGLYINRPMLYDEAYTVVAFADRPLWKAISDYHLPNNHVLHTLLVHFSMRWFGFSAWAARLPAMLAGALCVPAGYLAARSLYNRTTALLAAAWIAFSPVLVDFSANARGYTLLCLFVLIGLGLADYVRRKPNLLAWLLLTVCMALGFATLPTMLYPFGIIYGWLGLSWLANDFGESYRRRRFLALLLVSTAGAAALSLLLYLPALLNSGPQALFANRHVVSLSWYEFTGNLIPKAQSTWQFWTGHWPFVLEVVFAGGLLGSLLLHRRIARHKIHLLLPAILWIGLALIAQRVAPLPRIWLFLLPLLLILAAAGLAATGGLAAGSASARLRTAVTAASVAGLSLVLVASGLQGDLSYRPEQPLFGPVYEANEIAPVLLDQLQAGELIAANSPIQAPLRFRLIELGAPRQAFYDENDPAPFSGMIVVVERGRDLSHELYRLKLDGSLDPDSRVSIAETPALIAYRMDGLP